MEVNVYYHFFWFEDSNDHSEFLLGAPGANVSWQSNDDGTNIILSEQLVQPVPFGESGDHALDAVEYYCYKRVSVVFVRRIRSFCLTHV